MMTNNWWRDYTAPAPQALRAARQATGLSAAVLARHAGATLEDWQSWESGLAGMPRAAAWLLGLWLIYHT